MTCIVLAAGYATRMYPLTLTTPKPLLDVAGKTILDHILEKVARAPGIGRVVVVSNAKFHGAFLAWAERGNLPFQTVILNDGSTDNGNRLGAVADIAFAVDKAGIDEDALVLAGDNLFDFEISDFKAFFDRKNADCVTTHILDDTDRLRRTGVIEMGPDDRVLSFEEKPRIPKSRFAVPPFYMYRRDTLPLFAEFLSRGNDPDAPGNFIPWLLERKPVYAFRFSGGRYDIGSPESYREAVRIFTLRLTRGADSEYL